MLCTIQKSRTWRSEPRQRRHRRGRSPPHGQPGLLRPWWQVATHALQVSKWHPAAAACPVRLQLEAYLLVGESGEEEGEEDGKRHSVEGIGGKVVYVPPPQLPS